MLVLDVLGCCFDFYLHNVKSPVLDTFTDFFLVTTVSFANEQFCDFCPAPFVCVVSSVFPGYCYSATAKHVFYAPQLYRQVLLRRVLAMAILSVCLSVRPSQPGAEPSPGEIETSGLHHMVAWRI